MQLPKKQSVYQQYWLTYGFVFICISLFAIQVLTGVSPSQPKNQDLLTWGANWLFLSYTYEPWRLISSMFLHIGFIHIAFNLYALTIFGQVSERLFGRWFYFWIFIFSGMGGNFLNNTYSLLSLYLETNPDNVIFPALSAGASGGIMGLGGALLVCALLNVSANNILLDRKTLIWIMAINLGLGFVIPNIDNLGHIGGALIGGLMAYIYAQAVHHNQIKLGKIIAVTTVAVIFIGIYTFVQLYYREFLLQMLTLLT